MAVVPAARPGAPAATRLLILALAAGLLVLFALGGPFGPPALVALGSAGLLAVALLPRFPLATVLPALGLTLLTTQLAPGLHVFDGIVIGLAGMALAASVAERRRAAWDVRGPGYLALAMLALPLLAVPFTVVSLRSFLGGYKELALPIVLFLSLRRLVRWEDSRALLWVFPLVGTAAALQLRLKTSGLDARLYERMHFRNFYTNLGWGWSDYIAALLELCLLGTLLLGVLDRRWRVRVLLAVCSLIMLQGFLVLFSRAGTLALGAAGLVIAVGWGGRLAVAALGALAAVTATALATPGGQVIASRFVDPREYGSIYARLITWEQAWHRFVTHPFTGIGLNQGRYQMDAMGDQRGHNPMLDALMDQGILGGVLLLVLLVAIYRLCGRAVPRGFEHAPRTVRPVLAAVVTATFLHASVEPTLSGYALAFLFAWFLAWLALQDPRGRAPAPAGTV